MQNNASLYKSHTQGTMNHACKANKEAHYRYIVIVTRSTYRDRNLKILTGRKTRTRAAGLCLTN